jgi:hypothetical protein
MSSNYLASSLIAQHLSTVPPVNNVFHGDHLVNLMDAMDFDGSLVGSGGCRRSYSVSRYARIALYRAGQRGSSTSSKLCQCVALKLLRIYSIAACEWRTPMGRNGKLCINLDPHEFQSYNVLVRG